jgi:hypothetical protein
MGPHDRRADLVGVEVDADDLRRVGAADAVVASGQGRRGREDATDGPDRGVPQDEQGRRGDGERGQLPRDGRPRTVAVAIVEVQAPRTGRDPGDHDRTDADRAVADAHEDVRHVPAQPLGHDDGVG